MTRAEVVALFARREQAWRFRDPGGLASSHALEGVVASPIFGTVTGRAAIEQSYRDLFRRFADWTLTSQSLIIDGLRAAQIFQVHATHTDEFFGLPATGKRFELRGVLIFELQDGVIQHERRLYDFTGMLVQLGVLKAKPTR